MKTRPIQLPEAIPGALPIPLTAAARQALAALSLTTLLSSLGTSIANVALPTLAASFHASFQQVQWVVLAYLLAITTLIVSVGRLGDLLGRRRLLIAGVALFTVASALCGLAGELWQLIAARALQGLGAAAMMSLAMAFAASAVPRERTGTAMGLLGTMSAVGTALGPTAGGGLIALAGWPAIFWISVPLGALAALLAYRFLPADAPAADAPRPKFDQLGTLLLALTLAAFSLAMTLGRGHFGWTNALLLLGAAACGGLFALAQKKSASPLIRMEMLRHPVLGAGFAASALVTTVVMATLVVGPFYLGGVLGLEAAQIGLVMSTGPLVAALSGVPAGRLVDSMGARRAGLAGLAGMAAGAAALPWMAASYGVPGYIAPLALITAGYALFQAANNTAVMADVEASQRGVVSGLLNLSRNLGLITGASAMGALYALGGMQAAFGVAAVLSLAAAGIIQRNAPSPRAECPLP
ncbi:MFS transporter [Pseudoduganella aquatica]|uniref:MFS transporter n=1 Tax=Pseudoduganella aquatica TaxID=2660641 RepID=UPI001E35A9CF|nr:MFS transporter [Pseudoduganella aquatica]